MMANTEPCGTCQPCKAGRRCVRVLQLAPKDEAALRQLFKAGYGQHEGTFHMTPPKPEALRAGGKPEPTTSGICRRCGTRVELLTYLAEALKARGLKNWWPDCDACVAREASAA